MTKQESLDRWRLADGEEARLTPGAAADAEVWSRGFLPFRVRSEGSYRLRAAFPGTAVVLGTLTYEVLSETELPEDRLVVYRMRHWPDGEVVRDRVVYGETLVRSAQAERELAARRARARPFRFLLYPIVGLLPEEDQVRISERLGLYAVTATLVSGLLEASLILLVPVLMSRRGHASAILAVTGSAAFALLALPALGRAFAAFFLRETAGSAPVVLVCETLRALGLSIARADRTLVPLTRSAFWERLARPDVVTPAASGALVYRGLLPHLSWDGTHPLECDGDYWQVVPEPVVLDRGRLIHSYRLAPMADAADTAGRPPHRPAPLAYASEVLAGVRDEWDQWNWGFVWVTSLLASELQQRAFDHRGGPAAARRATLATAAAEVLLASYLLLFLPGAPGDPIGPFMGVAAVGLLVDAGWRTRAALAGRYAPSLLRFLVPSDLLRPERVAYQAHRDAERQIRGLPRPSR
jgi:hypothetical protein